MGLISTSQAKRSWYPFSPSIGANLEHGMIEILAESHVEASRSPYNNTGEKNDHAEYPKHANHLAVLGRGIPSSAIRSCETPRRVSALTEVARLLLAGKLKLTPDQRTRARCHITAIRRLAHQKTSKKEQAGMLPRVPRSCSRAS